MWGVVGGLWLFKEGNIDWRLNADCDNLVEAGNVGDFDTYDDDDGSW